MNRTPTKNILILLLVIVVSFGGILIWNTIDIAIIQDKVDGITQNQSYSVNPFLDGWSEECIQNKTTEKYTIYEENNISQYCTKECNIPPSEVSCDSPRHCVVFLPSYGGGKDAGRCFFNCLDNTKTPFIQYYNETICTKETLIKEVKE